MERHLAFEEDAEAFHAKWQEKEDELSAKITYARTLVNQVTYSKRDLLSIAALTSSLNVDGHRADLVILKAARAQAAFDGHTAINDMDIALAAELALPHRVNSTPFGQAGMTPTQLQERIEELRGETMPDENESEKSEGKKGEGEKKT